jgi:hypothetical protein
MSTNARDLIELRRDDPRSAELRKMAGNIIAAGAGAGAEDEHEGW